MTIDLPKLPYAYEDLEPFISKKTLEFHHDKHHAAYVNNLNKLIKGSSFEEADLETIIKESGGAIFNNAAQIWNHTFYFEQFGKGKFDLLKNGVFSDAIYADYGSLDIFKDKFSTAAKSLFGSGWVWLVKKPNGKLDIIRTSNAENPLNDGLKPILTCDVWEHAYYIDYQNRRPDYIESFWKIIDWEVIAHRY